MNMQYAEIAAFILTCLGVALSLLGRKPSVELGTAPRKPGTPYLLIYAAVVLLFGVFSVFYYRLLVARIDDVLFGGWLLLAMIGGMFAQVIAANYRARRRLFEVSRDRLLYPLLFSIVVFYPVWALGAASTHSFFAIHAAFLNGYFWENIVSAAKG